MSARAPLALALTTALALAACGGGSGGGASQPPGSDLATVVPANAPLFVEAQVRPQGSLETALRSSLSKLLGTPDPGGQIVAGFDHLNRETGVTYERDIKPWIGESAGVFLQSLRGNPVGVAETTDPEEALKRLRSAAIADGHTPHASTYHGVHVQSAGGDTFATVDGFVVTGPTPGVEAAIDAHRGSSLGDSGAFISSTADVPSDSFFEAWADPRRVIDELVSAGQLPPRAASQARSQFGALARQPLVLWGQASSKYLAVEASAGSSPASSPSSSSALAALPGDSWLAFAVHETAQQVKQAFGQTKAGAALGLRPSALFERAMSELALDPATLARWVGDVSGFLRGSSILGLGGALVVQTRDQAASLRTIRGIEAVLRQDRDLVVQRARIGGGPGFTVTPRGAPIQFVVTQKDGKVIAGIGLDSVTAALKPPRKLADSSAFKGATAALGSGISPQLYLDFQPLTSLFAIPGVINDPDFKRVEPYLRRLDYVVAGTGTSGNRSLLRIALGVRGGGGGGGSGAVSAAGLLKYAAINP